MKHLWPTFGLGWILGFCTGFVNSALGVVPFWLSCVQAAVNGLVLGASSTKVSPREKEE